MLFLIKALLLLPLSVLAQDFTASVSSQPYMHTGTIQKFNENEVVALEDFKNAVQDLENFRSLKALCVPDACTFRTDLMTYILEQRHGIATRRLVFKGGLSMNSVDADSGKNIYHAYRLHEAPVVAVADKKGDVNYRVIDLFHFPGEFLTLEEYLKRVQPVPTRVGGKPLLGVSLKSPKHGEHWSAKDLRRVIHMGLFSNDLLYLYSQLGEKGFFKDFCQFLIYRYTR